MATLCSKVRPRPSTEHVQSVPMWLSTAMPELTLIAEQCLATVPGGTGRYAAEIGAALAATAPRGWSVCSVTAWHRDITAARISGVAGPHRLPAGRRPLTALWERGLPPWPRGDSVHATTPLAPARRGAPLVAMVHDSVPWSHPETLTPRGVRWHRTMVARLTKTADAIVVPSRAVADELDSLLHLGDRLHVVPHGITALPLPTDPQQHDRVRRRLGLPKRYLLSLSTLEPRKGLDVLVGAMADPRLAGWPLVVVGQPGWGGIDVPTTAAEAGADPSQIRVLGRIPDDDLAVVLHHATALIVPSRAEGFGLPVLEGMAAGIPVIHTDIPALVEVAGGAGITVPVGDQQALAAAAAELFDDPDAAERVGSLGRAHSAGFTWQAAAEATWLIHLDLAG